MNLSNEFPRVSLSDIINTCGRKPFLEEITIIIPTLGRPILETCLAKIISGDKWPRGLIVVHQGDYPSVCEWVTQIKSTGMEPLYLRNQKLGKSTSINLAIKHTRTRFFAITDDDCFVEPDWLENMVFQLLKHPTWIVTGRVEPAGNETIAVVQSREASVQYRPRIKFDSMAGGNMGTSMEVVQKIGLFDEDPVLRYAAEDAEFAYRALKNGVPIAYAPEVAVSHFGWRSEKLQSDRFKTYAYGQGGFYGKYLQKGDGLIAIRTFYSFTRALRRWLFNTLKGEKELAALGRAYLTGMLPGIIDGIRYRTKE
jgi:GT2 family glycosyltransferase